MGVFVDVATTVVGVSTTIVSNVGEPVEMQTEGEFVGFVVEGEAVGTDELVSATVVNSICMRRNGNSVNWKRIFIWSFMVGRLLVEC